MDDRPFLEEKGFVLKNGEFYRFEPIGVTWNDSYCRKIANEGPTGCFVERDIDLFTIDDHPKNNCSGMCSMSQNSDCWLAKLIRNFVEHF